MDQQQTRNEILSLIESIDPACVSNCTIDLLNVLNLCYLISDNIVKEYESKWHLYSTKEMIKFWQDLVEGTAFETPLNAAPGRDKAVHQAIMQSQLAILYAHRAVCANEKHKLVPV
jgi:hypothetical protein